MPNTGILNEPSVWQNMSNTGTLCFRNLVIGNLILHIKLCSYYCTIIYNSLKYALMNIFIINALTYLEYS